VLTIHPLFSQAALIIDENIKKRRYMVISDLHIGFESNLYKRGINIYKEIFLEEIITELSDLVRYHKVDAIILLGDLKSTVGSISKQEWKEVPRFLKLLSEITDVYLVPGNHDSNIRLLTPENINVISSQGMVLGDTLLIHGHTMPTIGRSNVKRIIMGHIHPVFLRRNTVIDGQRVWVCLKILKDSIFPSTQGSLEIIIIPAYNRHLFSINEISYRKSISPLIAKVLKSDAVQQAIVVSLDGSIVGDREAISQII
jgi:putative SbcD/Mre11-related phosphoesterase